MSKPVHQASYDPHDPGRASGNPLVVIKFGDENILGCATSGCLNSVALLGLEKSTGSNGELRSHIFRKNRPVVSSQVISHNSELINDLVMTDWEIGSSEPSRVLASTQKSLSFAEVSANDYKPTIKWVDQFSFPMPLSCALNPLLPTEFAVVSSSGLFFGSVQDFLALKGDGTDYFHDIQVLAKDRIYNRLIFGLHPRSLLLSSRREIAAFDMRSRAETCSRSVLLDVREHWNLPWHDHGISIMKPLEARSYTLFVATQTSMNFVDLRMPSNPLLDWSLSLPLPPEQAALVSLNTNGIRSSVVTIGSRQSGYLEAFHSICDPSIGQLPLHVPDMISRSEATNSKAPGFLKRPMLWSDLPLGHLQQVKDTRSAFGMALIPFDDEGLVSLLQWTVDDGLVGQVLNLRAAEDEGHEDIEKGIELPKGGSLVMSEFQKQMHSREKNCKRAWETYPVQHSMPGSFLQVGTKRLQVCDMYDLRPCILRNDEDDSGLGGFDTLPRPFLGDIPMALKIRNQYLYIKDKGTEVEEEVSTKSKLQGELPFPQKDFTDLENRDPFSYGGLTKSRELHVARQSLVASSQSGESFDSICAERKTNDEDGCAIDAIGGELLEPDDGDGHMDELLEQIGDGQTLDEIGRTVRGGIAHNATPLGVDELQSSMKATGSIHSFDVEWHSMCEEDHTGRGTAVSTNGAMPNWVQTTVYYSENVHVGKALEMLAIEEDSGYGKLLMKMKTLFTGLQSTDENSLDE
ncbi:unnamed protein product [Chondrus crispus]|uniref:Uncharacterized protein n=1 Tax=Chondrus crispus TaxID=2769 RepID=R7QFG6_CHOCR|nr:unnamed protein product [Chondrus crispus]CDF36196.1 unnamed protein product [Chondrus crispus]|eukprot:XP_005716015.1 unnamed protein product [Chondrus crispus]